MLLGLPATPVLRVVQHGRDFITVEWSEVADGGGLLSKYVVSFTNATNGEWKNVTASVSTTR